MRSTIERVLDSTASIYYASAITLGLGLFFVFVWAPHPWGWQGIDAYHELARAIARGDGFLTTDVPWGYAYFAASVYWLFGERIWVPLLIQVVLNASVPVMLYHLARPWTSQRIAVLSSLIVGVFSFNTVYASTQVSDTICTVLFLAGLLCFGRGARAPAGPRFGAAGWFVFSGFLLGLVPQFRPNMVLFPSVMILAYLALRPRKWRKLAHMTVFAALVIAIQLPWIVRNYQLTGLFLPTSTHGGVQLWYGTLQVGPYLESRAHNPRFYFESAAFNYTSISNRPILVSTEFHENCLARPGGSSAIVYWTDRNPDRVRAAPIGRDSGRLRFELPAQPLPTTLYYFFESSWPATATEPAARFTTPFEGELNPLVSFVSDDHLGDLDRSDDVLDIFDVVRLVRHIAWNESVKAADKLDFNHDGVLNRSDLEQAIAFLHSPATGSDGRTEIGIDVEPDHAMLQFRDGSRLTLRRDAGARQTDLEIRGDVAGTLVSKWRTFTSIQYPPRRPRPGECLVAENPHLNDVFYRGEPHMMQRYMALALDNISRDPLAFAAASAYRAVRLFIIRGTDDSSTAQQFRWSTLAYGAGQVLSIAYLAIFLWGAAIAIRQRSALVLFLIPIVYVPLTICFVLTNMRYTVTVQPLMFMFVAVAVLRMLRLEESRT